MMRERLFPVLVLVWLALAGTGMVMAADPDRSETEITSDTLEFLKEGGIYLLKGNVTIRRGTMVLRADESEYDEKTSHALLRGNVFFDDGNMTIRSETADFNMESRTGRIENGSVFIRKDNYHIEAGEIEKKGEDHYLLKGATFTTCDAPLPAWCITTANADLIVGDRIRAGHATFRIKGIPVFYTPYLWAPVLTERTTGLLFPRFGYRSDLGLFYRQPLFIVLADNRDATVRLDYYSMRGVGEGLEYRYVERGDISGKWWAYHVRDRELDRDFYLLRASHRQAAGKGFNHFLHLNLINEKEFYQEYSSEVQARLARFLESVASAYYTTDHGRYYITSRYWQDLRYEDGGTAQRLPSAGMSIHPAGIGPLLASGRVEFTNFHTAGDFRVQRYAVSPEITASVGKAVRAHQTLRVTAAAYEISRTDAYPSDTERYALRYRAGLVSSLYRRYGNTLHEIVPDLYLSYATDSGYDAPLLDAEETLEERSEISLSLENRLMDGRGIFFTLRVVQPYSLRLHEQAWRPLQGDLYFNGEYLHIKLETSYDHYLHGIATANGDASISMGMFRAGVGQRYDRKNDVLFYTGRAGVNITPHLSLDSSIWYDEEAVTRKVRNFTSRAVYSGQCWKLSLSYTRKPDEYSISFMITLKGLGEFGVSAI